MDVSDHEQDVRIYAELPGVDSNNIDISLDGDVLTVQAEKAMPAVDPRDRYHIVERVYGRFQRSVKLPCAVDAAGAQARFDDGVLILTLPKLARQASGRKIPVQTGAKAGSPSATGTSPGPRPG